MITIIIFLTLVVSIIVIETIFHPRLDITFDGKLLLWYTSKNNNRTYKHLFTFYY